MITAVAGGTTNAISAPISAVPISTSATAGVRAEQQEQRGRRGQQHQADRQRPGAPRARRTRARCSGAPTAAPAPSGVSTTPAVTTERPCTYWRYCGSRNIDPRGRRCRRSGWRQRPGHHGGRARTRTSKSGLAAAQLGSHEQHAATTPITPEAITPGLVQPASGPSISANTTPPSATIDSTTPDQVDQAGAGPRGLRQHRPARRDTTRIATARSPGTPPASRPRGRARRPASAPAPALRPRPPPTRRAPARAPRAGT